MTTDNDEGEREQDAEHVDHEGDVMLLEELNIVGDVVTVEETGDTDVELYVDGESEVRMDRTGTYGLMWVPKG